MVDASAAPVEGYGPWHPGIESQVPERLLHLCTIFDPAHAFTSAAKARELKDLTGFDYRDLAALRPERLALHELLVRVTADLSVPDGDKVEDLGINFRAMVRALLARHVEPQGSAIRAAYDAMRRDSEAARASGRSRRRRTHCTRGRWRPRRSACDRPRARRAG